MKAIKETAVSFKMNESEETRTSRTSPLNIETVYERITPMYISSMVVGFKVIIQHSADFLIKQSTAIRNQDLDHKPLIGKITS